ncbi:MAG: ribosome biogenesis GTP-binding protein YihA/YsxC [candidate division KSB1 bacterium]|jgi:GTP-binding protein|nr:ribosome biogenesis GTP-binding protein YihA/YsxC [candidate division KSB1 bacterium]
MKVISAHFVRSVVNIEQSPAEGYPEIAFAGRSNVGKSSLINCLLNRKKLALTSSSPGKTRMLNYYEINNALYFVDLPGYGFAKVSRKERDRWKDLIEAYITGSSTLRGVVQIIDSRIGPTDLDMEMISWLAYLKKPTMIVATKTDKLPKSKRVKQLAMSSRKLEPFGSFDILPFSSVKREGRKELWKAINHLINENT